jgi:hypothetical protein
MHFKPPGYRMVETQTCQRACLHDEGLINAVCDEEKDLTLAQENTREEYSKAQLKILPRSVKWRDIAFCDEFHFGIGPQTTKHMKRKKGRKHRDKPENVHRKKTISKDTKAKAREDEHLELLNVFVVIGWNYRKLVPYKVPNKVGKMTTKVYTEHILPAIKEDLEEQGLILCQDADSAYVSKGTTAWAEKHNLPLLTLPGKSPDLSILESEAHDLKRKFHPLAVLHKVLLWPDLVGFLSRK